jgi:hypothetical protein
MMADHYLKVGDRQRIIQTLVDASGVPLDLTGASVKLTIRAATLSRRLVAGPEALALNLQAGASNPGMVGYDPAATDTALAGDYLMEWVLTYADGKPRTVPNSQYATLRIDPSL